MRVLVCGGRDYGNISHVARVLCEINVTQGIDVIVQGGASGADQIAREWAKHNGVNCITYAAEWSKHGRAAGPMRNQLMLDRERPNLVVAFPGGRGTADMIRRAKAAGVTVDICTP